MRSSTSGCVGAQVHAERVVGARLHLARSRSRSWSKFIVAQARMPSPPAALVADGEARRPATQPMPVCTIGYSTPNSSQTRVCSRGVRQLGTSWSREPVRVDDLVDQRELLVGRQPASPARRRGRRARSRWPRRPRRRSRPGAPSAAACGGRASRSRARARLVTTRRISWKRARPVAELGGAVVADAATRRRPSRRTPAGEWFGIQ